MAFGSWTRTNEFSTLTIISMMLSSAEPTAADDSDVAYNLSIDKLEQQFDQDQTLVEIVTRVGGERHGLGTKSEFSSISDGHVDSRNLLFYTFTFDSWLETRVGIEHLDWHDGAETSGLFHLLASVPLDVSIGLSLRVARGGSIETKLELEKVTALSSRFTLEPRMEWQRFSDEDDVVTAELRLRYGGTNKFRPYIGVAWTRQLNSDLDWSDTTALVGLSYLVN